MTASELGNMIFGQSLSLKLTLLYQFCDLTHRISFLETNISSVIRQKGESLNGCFKKAKHAKISGEQTFLTIRACAYQGVRNVCFSEILACFTFLKHPF